MNENEEDYDKQNDPYFGPDPYNKGLPSLVLGEKPVSYFEFWPTWFFYLPVVIYWLFLSIRYRSFSLPLVVNPNIPLSGMVGESKVEILDSAGSYAKSFILPYVSLVAPSASTLNKSDDLLNHHVDNALSTLRECDIALPVVAKPDLGCRGAGVEVIGCREALYTYLKKFPEGRGYILQEMAPYAAEAGVFYERVPGASRGRVTSLTLKYRPVVLGDGVSCLKALILQTMRSNILQKLYLNANSEQLYSVPEAGVYVPLTFAGSHCRGSIFRNGNEFISAELSEEIDKVMRDFPDFHYGRLDIKFSEINRLQQGEAFVIIEVNGVSSEKTHIWDGGTTLREAFFTLFEQYKTLFHMGAKMVGMGHKAPPARQLISTWLRELRQSLFYP